MAWTEEQKAQGRAELLRRKTHETAITLRNSFLNCTIGCLICLWVMKHMIARSARFPHWLQRLPYIYMALLALTAAAVAGTIAYVRFLDWRRRAAHDQRSSLQT